jgi:hypothetical protein
MLDINTINRRYFEIKIDGVKLDVEPPTMKSLKKIVAISKNRSESTIDELSEAVNMILSKNRTGYKVSDETIDNLDIDQLQEILTEYFKWLTEVKNSPN